MAPREGSLALDAVADERREKLLLGDVRSERRAEELSVALRDGAADRDSLGDVKWWIWGNRRTILTASWFLLPAGLVIAYSVVFR